jgi:flagellar protein FlbD
MIKLTRLDGSDFFINPDQIETIEETPDTHITLMNDNRYLVREKSLEIVEKIVAFKASVIHRAKSGRKQSHLSKLHRKASRLLITGKTRSGRDLHAFSNAFQ